MVNRVILIGRVGQKPEIKVLSTDSRVANFSLAVSEKYKDRSGEKIEKTTWVNCSVFGNLVGVVEKYIDSGSLIYIDGKLQIDQYEKNGEKRFATKVIIGSLTMLGGNQSQESTPQSKPSANSFSGGGYDDSEDEKLPF